MDMEKVTDVDYFTTSSQAESEGQLSRKVIIRYVDGSLVRGFLGPEDEATLQKNETVPFVIQDVSGHSQEVRPSRIKAVFFVKTFEGSPDYSEFKVFTNPPTGKGVWVRIRFGDGEVMEGVASNSLATYFHLVFSMKPPDPGSNNQTVIVSKRCLKEMQVLGLAAD